MLAWERKNESLDRGTGATVVTFAHATDAHPMHMEPTPVPAHAVPAVLVMTPLTEGAPWLKPAQMPRRQTFVAAATMVK